MSVSINIPEELFDQARRVAEVQHMPVEQVFASAFADQLAAWQRLRERAARGNREKFLAVLDKVADIEPEDCDSL